MLQEKLIITELSINFKNYQKLRSNSQSHRLKNTVLSHRSKIMNFPSLLLPTSTQSAHSYLHEKLLLWLSLQTKLLKRSSAITYISNNILDSSHLFIWVTQNSLTSFTILNIYLFWKNLFYLEITKLKTLNAPGMLLSSWRKDLIL